MLPASFDVSSRLFEKLASEWIWDVTDTPFTVSIRELQGRLSMTPFLSLYNRKFKKILNDDHLSEKYDYLLKD